jgi:hypothetical protein
MTTDFSGQVGRRFFQEKVEFYSLKIHSIFVSSEYEKNINQFKNSRFTFIKNAFITKPQFF